MKQGVWSQLLTEEQGVTCLLSIAVSRETSTPSSVRNHNSCQGLYYTTNKRVSTNWSQFSNFSQLLAKDNITALFMKKNKTLFYNYSCMTHQIKTSPRLSKSRNQWHAPYCLTSSQTAANCLLTVCCVRSSANSPNINRVPCLSQYLRVPSTHSYWDTLKYVYSMA